MLLQLDSAQLLRRLALAAVQQQLALVLLLQQEDLALRLPRPALEEEVNCLAFLLCPTFNPAKRLLIEGCFCSCVFLFLLF